MKEQKKTQTQGSWTLVGGRASNFHRETVQRTKRGLTPAGLQACCCRWPYALPVERIGQAVDPRLELVNPF